MNIDDLIKKVEAKESDLDELRERWNRRAAGFPALPDEKQINCFAFLEQFMSLENIRLLDVGCGTGRYLLLALETGAEKVVGVEIADKMLEKAEKTLNEAGWTTQSYDLVRSSWEEIDLEDRGWVKQFDLVMALKTPALNSVANVRKMLAASRRAFFFSNHLQRIEPLFQELYAKVHGFEKAFGNEHAHVLAELLEAWGYKPITHTFEICDTRAEPIADLLIRYGDWIFQDFPKAEEKEWLRQELLKLSHDGETVNHTATTTEAFTFVDVRDV
ncbi:MAG: class I SAM-dependent methyltransferase [Eubacteriales bacterium]|nr:class I SAM-dependent methyltransferase [Eubacteriales bacterium]MDD4541876.1 class I SAM-dependent methyltransferase [Eubacteriales bacterium]